jgi:uncharacterized protein (DUF433 family)
MRGAPLERRGLGDREMNFDQWPFDISSDPREVPRYAVSEVALYLHLPETTLRSWLSGRTFPKASGVGTSPPLIDPADGEGSVISFYNLSEAHILKWTRQRDEVPMKAIRDALDYVATEFPSKHPLITQQFLTDGRFLFIKKLEELINASKMGQLGNELLLNLERIDRDTMGMPVAVYPEIPRKPNSKAIAIRYGVSSGAPVINGTGILVSVIWGRYEAGDTTSDLAQDYDLPVETLEDALAYLESEAA